MPNGRPCHQEAIERILSFWADNARLLAPGLPAICGKAALRSYVEGALAIPGFHIAWTTSEGGLRGGAGGA